jgi:phytoene synthase
MSHLAELAPAFEAARLLHKKHGKSYYFATRLFPRDMRLATHALYGFFRVPDEIVDNSPMRDDAEVAAVKHKLDEWQDNWSKAYRDGDSADPILHVTSYVFHKYSIPYGYSEAFLAAMITDIDKSRYRDYAELEEYMYGSAAVVGLMMAHVIGFRDGALDYAPKLGYAMQLTNFLRDIDEDYVERKRVYMPQDELDAFGVSYDDIATRRFSEDFKRFMIFQSGRAHRLYEEADRGIPLLSRQGRFPVRVASTLYRAILGKIAEQDYNIFKGRARTSFGQKLMLTLGALRKNHE